MRKEVVTVGDYVHVYNRGNRKQAIVRKNCDRWRFLQMLYYFNTLIAVANPFRRLEKKLGIAFNKNLIWPGYWPSQKPIVTILAFSLMENHFHLFLKEIVKGGVVLFMRKLGTGMAAYFNSKYQEPGRLFQGPYKAKTIHTDEYLRYLSVYIQVKNPFELYPKGFRNAIKNFDQAYQWVVKYPYCSLANYAGEINSPIIDKDILREMFPSSQKYKKFARDCIFSINLREKLGMLTID
ncbi:MAG: transposase [Candidatus Omnitrophica bacterium]|nr:transposase [Candidatus Omnitrophota bacterium]